MQKSELQNIATALRAEIELTRRRLRNLKEVLPCQPRGRDSDLWRKSVVPATGTCRWLMIWQKNCQRAWVTRWTISGSLFMMASLSFRLIPVIFWAVVFFFFLTFGYIDVPCGSWTFLTLVSVISQRGPGSFSGEGYWETEIWLQCMFIVTCDHWFCLSQQTGNLYILPKVRNYPQLYSVYLYVCSYMRKIQEVVL